MFTAIIWYIETCQEAAAEKQIAAYLLVTGDCGSAQSRAGKTTPWAWTGQGHEHAGSHSERSRRGLVTKTQKEGAAFSLPVDHLFTQLTGLVIWSYGFPGRSSVKKPPANSRDMVRSLVQEDPLEKDIATHSGILPWKILWTEEPGGLHTVHEVPKESLLSNWTTTTMCLV